MYFLNYKLLTVNYQLYSPTSAPRSIGGLVAPFHNPRSHFISLFGCNPHTNKSTHKQPVKLHFISQRLFHSAPNPPMPFPYAFPIVYFSYCVESTPKETKRLSGRAVSLLHLIGECLGYRQYKKATIRPHHPLVVQKINIFWVDYPCACGICVHSSPLHSRNYVRTSLRTLTFHSAFISCTHLSTAQLREILISISQAHSFRFPQALFQRISNGIYLFLRRVSPKRSNPLRESG